MTTKTGDYDRKELFRVLLDLLKKFDAVCSENRIRYFVDGGTMLGAIRHKGFIPWDDDIDIVVPREDYNRLKRAAAAGAFPHPYFFQNPATDEGYSKGFSRLRNSLTTEIPFMDFTMRCNQGVFIDIFPLDAVPDDRKRMERQCANLHKYRSVMNAYSRYYSGVGAEGSSLKKKAAYAVSKAAFKAHVYSGEKVFGRMEKEASKYALEDCARIGTLTATFESEKFIYPKELWEGTILVDFEDMKVPVPERVDELLTFKFGDYMTPVREKTNHGDMFVSTEVPYEEFIREHYDELKKGWLDWHSNGKKRREAAQE